MKPQKFWYNNGFSIYDGIKLTQSQTEIVLTAHAQKRLKSGGQIWQYNDCLEKGCVNQFIYNEPLCLKAQSKNWGLSVWFDLNYKNDWTIEKLLTTMEENEMIES
jgi:hypothetical protein